MKPCDCLDRHSLKYLNEQGLTFNDKSIVVNPCSVTITIGSCSFKISQKIFKAFAEWYLEDQQITKCQLVSAPNCLIEYAREVNKREIEKLIIKKEDDENLKVSGTK